ncbi:hypothetical protein ACYHQE_001469 [Aeromonas salmonicida]
MTQAIEGISLLPIEAGNYREYLDDYVKSGHDPAHLNELHFFKNCSSVVSIISLPKEYKLSYMDLNRLKSHLNGLFPNTTLKRYALVIGASANISLTTLIVKSPCLSDDFLTLIVAFIKRCFAKDHYRFDDHLDKVVIEMICNEEWNEELLDSMLNEFENPAKILDTNWYAIKPMYEKKYRELIREKEKFVSINDIRLSRESVKKALLYLREIYRHRVSKTRILSLNPRLGETAPWQFREAHRPAFGGELTANLRGMDQETADRKLPPPKTKEPNGLLFIDLVAAGPSRPRHTGVRRACFSASRPSSHAHQGAG